MTQRRLIEEAFPLKKVSGSYKKHEKDARHDRTTGILGAAVHV